MGFPVHRPRRLRSRSGFRENLTETFLDPARLIYPVFVDENAKEPQEIAAMPGQFRWPLEEILRPIEHALQQQIQMFMLFGIPAKKDPSGSSAWDQNSIVAQAVKQIKGRFPEAMVMTDVCLCAYTDHGHCGVFDSRHQVDNDASLPLLAKIALSHAHAGADLVAPSDMMDGRVQEIRKLLDQNGFPQLPIMAYSAKFASAFYGPFREAADCAPQEGDRRGYQMDPGNCREALWEMALDLDEGADVLMVKPGMPYLDILSKAREQFSCPLAAYQVSGEYSMIKAAARLGWVDERQVALEALVSMRRAGADWILSYFAPEVATWIGK